ncbi:MAG: hypothetical protein KGI38_07875 [Thaumarchaeota archaeon]|nr:hypothetical protein [Nitrososphaerota archaeon]
MKADVFSVTAMGVAAALGLPWAGALLLWLGSPGLFPTDLVEDAVFLTVLLRVLLFFGVRRIRSMKPGTLVIFFLSDMLIFLVATLMTTVTGDQSFIDFGVAFTASWLSTSFLLYPGVLSFFVVRSVTGKARLSYLLPAAAGAFGIVGLELATLSSGSGSGGLAGVIRQVLGGLRTSFTPAFGASDIVFGCGALLFAALAVRSVTAARNEGQVIVPVLAICVAGVVALAAWLLLLPPLGGLITLGLPAAVIVGGVWVMTREG